MRRLLLLLLLLAPPARAELRLSGPAGSTILLEEDRALPVVTLSVVQRGGAAALPPGQPNVLTWLPLRALGPSGHALRERLWRAGLQSDADYQSVSFRVRALRNNVDEAAAALAQALLSPALRLPAGEVLDYERWKSIDEKGLGRMLAARRRAELRTDAGRLRLCLRRVLYGAHPLGAPLSGGDDAEVGAEEAIRAFQRGMRGGNVLFGLSGPLGADEAQALVARHFGGLLPGPALRPAAAPPPPPRPRLHLVPPAEPGEIHIAIGQRAPLPGGPAWAALDLAAVALRGTLPDDGPPLHLRVSTDADAGLVYLSGESQAKDAAARIDELLALWQGWLRSSPRREILSLGARYQRDQLAMARQRPADRLDEAMGRALADAGEWPADAGPDPQAVAGALRALARDGAPQICVSGEAEALAPLLRRWAGRTSMAEP